MNIEMGIQNQLKKYGSPALTTTSEITSQTINNVQGSWNRSRAPTNQFVKPTICPNCGYGWSHFIDKNVLPVARTVKIAELPTTLQKFVEKTKNLLNPNPE